MTFFSKRLLIKLFTCPYQQLPTTTDNSRSQSNLNWCWEQTIPGLTSTDVENFSISLNLEVEELRGRSYRTVSLRGSKIFRSVRALPVDPSLPLVRSKCMVPIRPHISTLLPHTPRLRIHRKVLNVWIRLLIYFPRFQTVHSSLSVNMYSGIPRKKKQQQTKTFFSIHLCRLCVLRYGLNGRHISEMFQEPRIIF